MAAVRAVCGILVDGGERCLDTPGPAKLTPGTGVDPSGLGCREHVPDGELGQVVADRPSRLVLPLWNHLAPSSLCGSGVSDPTLSSAALKTIDLRGT